VIEIAQQLMTGGTVEGGEMEEMGATLVAEGEGEEGDRGREAGECGANSSVSSLLVALSRRYWSTGCLLGQSLGLVLQLVSPAARCWTSYHPYRPVPCFAFPPEFRSVCRQGRISRGYSFLVLLTLPCASSCLSLQSAGHRF
jgi:hypothetical protein